MPLTTELRQYYQGMLEQMVYQFEIPQEVALLCLVHFATLDLYQLWGREKMIQQLSALIGELAFLETIEGFKKATKEL